MFGDVSKFPLPLSLSLPLSGKYYIPWSRRSFQRNDRRNDRLEAGVYRALLSSVYRDGTTNSSLIFVETALSN